MRDFNINITNLEFNIYDYSNYTDYYDYDEDESSPVDIPYVLTCIIISIGLPLTLVAIYALYSLVRKDNVAPIYVINLLITDLIQLCCMTVGVVLHFQTLEVVFIYYFALLASVGFMVCIALERYLIIAWPLWYRFRRTVKISLLVCVVVWTLPLVFVLPLYFQVHADIAKIFGIFLLLPYPLLVFFLAGTIKALSAANSVASDKKCRIVGLLVLVVLIYTLLFLPSIIWALVEEQRDNDSFRVLSFILLKFSPLADLLMYVFLKKGAVNKLLASLCCCRMNSRSTVNDANMHTVSSMYQ